MVHKSSAMNSEELLQGFPKNVRLPGVVKPKFKGLGMGVVTSLAKPHS
jgi:hypothetical protein